MTDMMTPTTDTLADHLELIAKILPYQDRDSLLRLSVVLSNLELQGDGCSLFLYQPERNDLELRESTVLTRFLGRRINLGNEQAVAEKTRELLRISGKRPEELDRTLTAEEVNAWNPDLMCPPLRGFGLTRWAVQFNCPLVISNIHQDIRWSAHLKTTTDADPGQHCELPYKAIGSIAIVTFGHEAGPLPRGVLRVVRRQDHPAGGLGECELAWLKGFARHLSQYLDVAVTLADLLDLGSKLEFEDFGKSLVDLLKRVLNAKGCSIFLELETTEQELRDFHCVATTGLFQNSLPITNKLACYTVDPKQETIDSLTGWVLRFGQLVDLESTVEFDASRLPGLDRPRTEGKTSETPPGDSNHGGPILISPLFLHQGGEAVGAIRVVRSRAVGQSFLLHEKLLFLDISRRLSKVLTNLHLRQVSEQLINLYRDPQEILRRVPREVCRLLGVEGCSVLRLDPDHQLRLAATKGKLEGWEEKLSYNLENKGEGWTGWVARRKLALLLNSPTDAPQVDLDDPPIHSPNDPSLNRPHLCEIEQPVYRFLAIPILEQPGDEESKVLGVIRMPRGQSDPLFHQEHQSILTSFAARLSLALNLAWRNETLQAVADLADPDKIQAESGEPAKIVEQVVERARSVLSDKLELTKAKIHPEYQPPTRVSPQTLPPGFQEREIRLGRLRLGTISYQPERAITQRQQNLLDLVAGVCANALFSKVVYEKLDALRRGLIRVGEEMTSASPLSQKLKTIAQVAAEVTWADTVIIHEFLAPKEKQPITEGQFRESAWGGAQEPTVWKETAFKPDAVPFTVVELDQPVFAAVAQESTVLYHKKNNPNFIDREEIQSAAALPLRVSGTCVGCIFFNYRVKRKFRAQTRQEILLMTEYAAIAIHQGRLLEETRQLVQEKSHLLKEKSNLLSFADHSLKQPLTGLTGFFSNLIEGVYHDRLRSDHLVSRERFCESDLVRIAKKRYRLCDYINYLIKNFFTIDRIEVERRAGAPKDAFPLEFTSCNLNQICEQAVEVAEAVLVGKIRCNTPQSTVYCRIDGHAIQMAILNVLINAVKFSRSSKDSQPQEPKIELQLTTRGNWIAIQIDDNGPGIHRQDSEHIFELFYRGETSSPGSGIGLFLTLGYVKAHGGRVEVASSDFGGSRFVIHLPLAC